MFCRKCGTKNEDSDIFCSECGARLMPIEETGNVTSGSANVNSMIDSNEVATPISGVSARIQAAQSQSNQTYSSMSQVPNAYTVRTVPSKKLPVIAFIVCALVIVFALGAGVLFLTNRNTIDINKYVVAKVNGYNGYGSCMLSIDWDSFEADYEDRVRFKKSSDVKCGVEFLQDNAIGWVEQQIYLNDSYNNLSNGDYVTYKLDINESAIEDNVNCKIKYKDEYKYQIKDLPEPKEFDPFSEDILTVSFTGVSPNGVGEFEIISPDESDVDYTGLKYEFYDASQKKEDSGYRLPNTRKDNLANGDSVTICIDQDIIESFVYWNGLKPCRSEATYTVNGLGEYVQSLSDISEDDMESMREQCKQWQNDNFDSDDYASLKNLEPVGELLYVPDDEDPDCYNRLLIVYKATIRNRYKSGKKKYDKLNHVYYYITYSNVVIASDGSLETDIEGFEDMGTWYNYRKNLTEFDSKISNMTWSYYGYKSFDELREYASEKCEEEGLRLANDSTEE